jgi:regulatory protein
MARRRPPRHDHDATPPTGSPRLVALRLLGRRDYTADELTRKLLDRGFTEDNIAPALAGLTAEGLLNDRRAALAHVRTATRVKGRGPLRIRLELQARGVPAEIITEATRDVTDDDVRATLDRVLARKHLVHPVSLDQRRRLFQQLLRRGFPAPLISAALRFRPDDDA